MTEPELRLERRFASRAEAQAAGRARRKVVPRRALGERTGAGRDPVVLLEEQNVDRVPELVPLRTARMVVSPFTFFRGTAGLMAHDLAADPSSGILVAACGDAHLSNFGFFASPERRLVFDLNDFDEAAIAPWEWDVKRLLTSVVIGGRDAGYDEADVAGAAAGAFAVYARSLRKLVERSPADRYFTHLNIALARRSLDRRARAVLNGAVAAAERRTGERVLRRTTERDADGRLRFVEDPPTMTHVALESGRSELDVYADYLRSVDIDVALMLAQYVPVDVVRRVVGVGSVGTRCFLVLLAGSDDDALVLQVKEAGESVLSRQGGVHQPSVLNGSLSTQGQGARVTGYQRVLQALSDPLLGHLRSGGRDYYVRQFHDMKGAIELDGLDPASFAEYAAACAAVLARAHAQSPSAEEVVGYIGSSPVMGRALVEWSFAYAAQSLADHAALRAAVAAGRVPIAPGPA